jgi:hypothetical protein
MSNTISIKVTNQKAFKLLKDLESLNLIEIIKKKSVTKNNENIINSLIGCIPSSKEEIVLEELANLRNEWDRNS